MTFSLTAPLFVEVSVPLPIDHPFTYRVPEGEEHRAQGGVRALVPPPPPPAGPAPPPPPPAGPPQEAPPRRAADGVVLPPFPVPPRGGDDSQAAPGVRSGPRVGGGLAGPPFPAGAGRGGCAETAGREGIPPRGEPSAPRGAPRRVPSRPGGGPRAHSRPGGRALADRGGRRLGAGRRRLAARRPRAREDR